MAGTGILFNIDRKVEKVANHSLVSDSEISKLSLYPSFDGDEGLDARITSDESRITAIESAIGDGEGALASRMTAAESALETLNGASSTEGSVAYAVASAKSTIDAYTVNGYAINTSPVLNAQDVKLDGFTADTNSALTGISANSTVTAAVDKIDEVLAVVTGASTVTGSIAKAEADAKAYTDSKVSALGSVFNYKGTKATLADLQAVVTGNKVGDVWTVTNASGATADQNLEYVCTAVDASTGAGTWERLGTNVDLSGYYTKTEVQAFTINGKAIYQSPTLSGADIALGSGYSAVTGSVLTGIATGSTIDAAFDKVDEVLADHNSAINTLNGDATTVGSVAKAVADEATIARAAELKLNNKLSYEFVSSTTSKTLEDKLYIVRNAKLTGTLPSGDDIPENVAIRVIANPQAAALGCVVKLAAGSTDKLNGSANVPASGADPEVVAAYPLGDPSDPTTVDVTFIYDSTNHDWVPIEVRI